MTDAKLACLAVAQVPPRFDDERHRLRAAPARVGHLLPRLPGQWQYNGRLKNAGPLMEAALRWLAEATPGSAEMLRLMDGTPVPCGAPVLTTRRPDLFGYAGYGYCASHSRWYRGSKLMLIVTCDGTVTGFALANPKLTGERGEEDFEDFLAGPDLGLTLLRPARKDDKAPRPFPAIPGLAPPASRGDHRDAQEPARPGTPRRPGPRRALGAHRPAAARAQRRHLA